MQTLTFLFAFIAVLGLIGVAAWLVRRFANNRLGPNTNRGRMPRLAVIDAAAVDGRRRLVLVRRDNVEHLLMIGGPTDIVVESSIVRATSGRDQVPRAATPGEQPPRIAPLPDVGWGGEPARTEPRTAEAFDLPAEPQMPEPPPRPASRPVFPDDVRRQPAAERRSDPLAGFAPEPPGGRVDAAPARLTRSEPMMPRPARALESSKAPARAAAPPPTPPPVPTPSSADQNLAEMAQRLEAALRRPPEPVAPPVAPETPTARPPRNEAPAPAATPKGGFDNLEDEMASLLGRPKTPS
ncbi:flagellar biosynthetic protein FliO [Bradyrhizobium sp.]|uniref:flagellar biosynthetic protein FliO n=1 Tax=Bradyrhizobium sp. TaxID=376 RepID=UPI0025BA311B|nr:flagellar biosynthetic protein FliO [Bradyrhizobium sp.]